MIVEGGRRVRVIYIDVLLCINLVINFLLLSATAFYLHEKPSVLRLILGAFVGALGSLAILLPVLPFVLNFTIKAAVGSVTVLTAFGRRRLKDFAKLFAVFLTATFFFGGAAAAMWFMFTPRSLVIKNSVVYLSIPPIMLIILSILCYFLFRAVYSFSGQIRVKQEMCVLTVTTCAGRLRTIGKIDTGNSLKEPFSQCPVIVMTRKVGGRGILPCFRADEVLINDRPCRECIYIALCADDRLGDYKALVPSAIC